MARPTKGLWASQQRVPPVSGIWGTGINDIHQYYGSPPARMQELHPRLGEFTPPYEAIPEHVYAPSMWGYEQSPIGQSQLVPDDRPDWTVDPEDNPNRRSTGGQPPLNAPGAAKTIFRAIKGGAYNLLQYKPTVQALPSETVSEGWENKPHGSPADAKPSDPSQYIIQTSMVQRYRTRNSEHAVARGADEPRAGIESRVVGQHTPVYSTGERSYDMFPFQQDQINRLFWYRTAGTGDPTDMAANEAWETEAIERTPPPDPYIGTPDSVADYGFTSEDQFYA
jgi:hypothetical protein